jgi:uncharacterized protein YbjT (DUF2867 family)
VFCLQQAWTCVESFGIHWANQGCKVVVAEMNDAVGLARAFDGAEAVFILLPPNIDPAPGIPESKAVIAALSESPTVSMPQRVVCLSTIGAHATQPNLSFRYAALNARPANQNLR